MSIYEAIAELPLVVEGYTLDCLATADGDWKRQTTVVSLAGASRMGQGEDVNYSERDQQALVEAGAVHDLAGTWTIESFSQRLDQVELGPVQPEYPGMDGYRRWAFESAALDLALRQAGRSLFDLLGREPRQVRFVSSSTLPDESGMQALRRLLAARPGLGLKLDAVPGWTSTMIDELAATGCVEVIDFKGAYEGTPVDTEPDADLYRRVTGAFPEALLEDPHRTDEVLALLEPERARVTWDAPVHGVDDIRALPWKPRVVNFKPSRFGTLRALFDAYDHCAAESIGIYGGGQSELGPGRGQIQLLASLFHPDAPNDVAPSEYNTRVDPATLPGSPLPAPVADVGFRWERGGPAR